MVATAKKHSIYDRLVKPFLPWLQLHFFLKKKTKQPSLKKERNGRNISKVTIKMEKTYTAVPACEDF